MVLLYELEREDLGKGGLNGKVTNEEQKQN